MISEYYTDEELMSQLAIYLDENTDFQSLLGQVETIDENTFQIRAQGRTFQFGKEICNVEEIT